MIHNLTFDIKSTLGADDARSGSHLKGSLSSCSSCSGSNCAFVCVGEEGSRRSSSESSSGESIGWFERFHQIGRRRRTLILSPQDVRPCDRGDSPLGPGLIHKPTENRKDHLVHHPSLLSSTPILEASRHRHSLPSHPPASLVQHLSPATHERSTRNVLIEQQSTIDDHRSHIPKSTSDEKVRHPKPQSADQVQLPNQLRSSRFSIADSPVGNSPIQSDVIRSAHPLPSDDESAANKPTDEHLTTNNSSRNEFVKRLLTEKVITFTRSSGHSQPASAYTCPVHSQSDFTPVSSKETRAQNTTRRPSDHSSTVLSPLLSSIVTRRGRRSEKSDPHERLTDYFEDGKRDRPVVLPFDRVKDQTGCELPDYRLMHTDQGRGLQSELSESETTNSFSREKDKPDQDIGESQHFKMESFRDFDEIPMIDEPVDQPMMALRVNLNDSAKRTEKLQNGAQRNIDSPRNSRRNQFDRKNLEQQMLDENNNPIASSPAPVVKPTKPIEPIKGEKKISRHKVTESETGYEPYSSNDESMNNKTRFYSREYEMRNTYHMCQTDNFAQRLLPSSQRRPTRQDKKDSKDPFDWVADRFDHRLAKGEELDSEETTSSRSYQSSEKKFFEKSKSPGEKKPKPGRQPKERVIHIQLEYDPKESNVKKVDKISTDKLTHVSIKESPKHGRSSCVGPEERIRSVSASSRQSIQNRRDLSTRSHKSDKKAEPNVRQTVSEPKRERVYRQLCGRCGFPVYFNEHVFSMATAWHSHCLNCCVCLRPLSLGKHTVVNGLPTCAFPCSIQLQDIPYRYYAGARESRP